jgi:hypothetical protein
MGSPAEIAAKTFSAERTSHESEDHLNAKMDKLIQDVKEKRYNTVEYLSAMNQPSNSWRVSPSRRGKLSRERKLSP